MQARISPFPSLHPSSGLAARSAIIVADDDAVVHRLCCRTLEEDGVTVLEAEDGEAVLRLIEDHSNVDLVITDLTMPPRCS